MAAFLEIDPDARAVVVSGHTADPVLADPLSHGFSAAAGKPFTIQQWRKVLAPLLGPPPQVT